MTPDIQKLKALSTGALARAVFEMFAKRRRARAYTNIQRLRRILRESGTKVTDKEITEFFDKLEAAHVGHVTRNKRNFAWSYSCVSVANAARGKGEPEKQREPKTHLPTLEPAEVTVNGNGHGETVHPTNGATPGKIIIRKGDITVEAPTVMTDKERQSVRELLSDISVAS